MKNNLIKILAKALGEQEKDIEDMLEAPPRLELGDWAYPCFALAKKKKKNPLEIAKELTEQLRKNLPKEITNVQQAGGYVNFYVDKELLAKQVLKDAKKPNFGSKNLGKGSSIGIEFSQPNTHKAFHVGHIRGTSIGESLSRIWEFEGKKVVRMNYSGDTGMHIAKWIWCYQNYHSKEKLKEDEAWIASIYVDAVKRLADNEKLQEQVDEINRKLETKEDKEINELWKKTRKLSIDSWKNIYEQLNTSFDKYYFESEVEEQGKRVAEELLKKKVAKKDDAIFMDLEKEKLGVWVLLRKDATVLYSAKDIALAQRKVKEYDLDEYLVAVADEQQLHFRQLCKTLELMKFKKADGYHFLTFGLVRFPQGKMSSRTGNNTLYSEFYAKVFDLAKKSITSRGTKMSAKELEQRAKTIAIAAMKYGMLKQANNKVIIFNPDEALAFEGDTGPYLLYSYARASSISRKVKSKKAVKIIDLKDQEIMLIKKIAAFPDLVEQAYKQLAPNLIANYAFELAQRFNEFYHECPVLGNEQEGFRLALIEAFRVTLHRALDLLGIETLEEM